MNRMLGVTGLCGAMAAASGVSAGPAAPAGVPIAVAAKPKADAGAARASARYAAVVRRVAAMPEEPGAQQKVGRGGLEILNVLWEDTGRWQGSSIGPNISDVTIEVELKDARGRTRTALMPVIRNPNFSDKTGDVALDKLRIPVGNQSQGGALSFVSLRDFLAAPARFMSLPGKGTIKGGSLLARRDSHALVSAQATLLPVPHDAQATFWPVIFNYQSSRKNPAVLTLLVTRQGTSMTVIDNARDTLGLSSWGQRLFFNDGGQRAPLTAERRSDVESSGVTMNGESARSLGQDANLMMIIQVPLKYREPSRRDAPPAKSSGAGAPCEMLAPPAPEANDKRSHASDVEAAVLGHGPELGPYTELAGLRIERDPRFPVRVTVQFYQATSNGVLASADVKRLRAQIKQVYASADYVGSLVVPAPADRARPTNWDGVSVRPPGVTLQDFPGLIQRQQDGDGRLAGRPGLAH